MNNSNYFSNKMKENMKIIDDLISKGFKIESNNFFKSIVKTPEGKSLLLIEIPFGRKQNTKYESDYHNTIFPEFSWLAFFLPMTCFLRIKHYSNFFHLWYLDDTFTFYTNKDYDYFFALDKIYIRKDLPIFSL